ncbi:MAG: hypothetical protein O3B87_05145, partial [bacterium]|nr:hypothetical protein [bacterium]
MTATLEQTETPLDQSNHLNTKRKIDEYKENRFNMQKQEQDRKKEEITEEVKRAVQRQSSAAEDASKSADLLGGGQVPAPKKNEAQVVANAINLFINAAQENLINPPTHGPTRILYDHLKEKLLNRGITPTAAVYLQPLINGILNTPNYVQFSVVEGQQTQFEQDLTKIVGVGVKSQAEEYLEDAVSKVGGSLGITLDKFREKTSVAKKTRSDLIQQEAQALMRNAQEHLGSTGMERGDYAESELIKIIGEGTGITNEDLKNPSIEELINTNSTKSERDYALQALDL